MHQFVLEFSCYENKLKVLLDGKTPLAKDSAVLQYTSEPFYRWCGLILELLYREIFEDYALVYVGRKEEAEVLQFYAQQYEHCRQFAYRQHECNTPLQERMIALSRLIKTKQAAQLPPICRTIGFYGKHEQLDRLKDQIQALSVKNQYCQFAFSAEEYPAFIKTGAIHLADTCEDIEEILRDHSAEPYAFILVWGNETRFLKAQEGFFIYEYGQEGIFQAVFSALLLIPLQESFSEYLRELIRRAQTLEQRNLLTELLIVKPRVQVATDNRVELGCSIPLNIQTIPVNATIPELVFEYQVPGIVSCTQKRVYGEKEGKTQVIVYEKGEFEPVGTLNMAVFKRNRIKKITISEAFRDCGIGDTFQLACEYYPEDADNVSSIVWYSENPQVAEVTKEGEVRILSSGECRVFCSADSVSTSCTVRSRPYLRNIHFMGDIETGFLHLEIGEKRTIEYELEPESPFDRNLMMTSQNLLIANVTAQTIIGVSNGTTTVIVENNTQRVRREIQVTVGRTEEKPKKSLFKWFTRNP